MTWTDLFEWLPQLLVAAGGTLKMTALAYALAVIAGLLIALARTSRRRAVSAVATCYVELIRGVPLISAEHEPHLPALQFQRTARSGAWLA